MLERVPSHRATNTLCRVQQEAHQQAMAATGPSGAVVQFSTLSAGQVQCLAIHGPSRRSLSTQRGKEMPINTGENVLDALLIDVVTVKI